MATLTNVPEPWRSISRRHPASEDKGLDLSDRVLTEQRTDLALTAEQARSLASAVCHERDQPLWVPRLLINSWAVAHGLQEMCRITSVGDIQDPGAQRIPKGLASKTIFKEPTPLDYGGRPAVFLARPPASPSMMQKIARCHEAAVKGLLLLEIPEWPADPRYPRQFLAAFWNPKIARDLGRTSRSYYGRLVLWLGEKFIGRCDCPFTPADLADAIGSLQTTEQTLASLLDEGAVWRAPHPYRDEYGYTVSPRYAQFSLEHTFVHLHDIDAEAAFLEERARDYDRVLAVEKRGIV